MGGQCLPPLLDGRVSPSTARPPRTSAFSSKWKIPVGRPPVSSSHPPLYDAPSSDHHRLLSSSVTVFPPASLPASSSMASPVDAPPSSAAAAPARPTSPASSSVLPSLPSPPDDMYTMPFLPPPSPLSPRCSYPQHHRQQQLSLPDDPFDPPAPPAPPPPVDDLCSSGGFPFFPATFPEGFGDEDCYSWDVEALPWTNFCGGAVMGDLLDVGDVGGGGLEAAVRVDKSATETGRAECGGGALLLPAGSRRPEQQPGQQQQQQQQVGRLGLEMQQWSGMAKAARSKRRIARQMSNSFIPRFVLPRRSSSSSSSSPSTPTSGKSSRRNAGGGLPTTRKKSPAARAIPLFPPMHMGLRYVLHKELKNSDVTTLGRIVLPKRESEAYLPFLAVKEGIQITVKDMFSPDAWRMRYRFWPNNKSRMYVLENTGVYVKKNGLGCGDVVALYQDESKQLYICSKKVENTHFNHSFVGCTKEEKVDEQYMLVMDGLPEESSEKVECSFISADASSI